MKSFPSSFTKNKLVNDGLASGNLKQTLKNIANASINTSLGGSNVVNEKKALGARIKWYERNFNENLNNIPYTDNSNINEEDTNIRIFRQNATIYENANKIPAIILASINKYRKTYNTSAIQYGSLVKNPDGDKNDDTEYTEVYQEAISPSLFNPWFGVRTQGFILNSPLMYMKNKNTSVEFYDGEDFSEGNNKIKKTVNMNNMNGDFTDCSIKTLVNLNKNYPYSSKQDIGPGGFYRYADFMYCKELGKISNNHLITLRRFTHPVGDNIFKAGEGGDLLPDKGRLVTWFGTDDNKLEDICKFNYKTTWKQLDAKIDDIQSKEDNPKLLPSIINISTKEYRGEVAKGLHGDNAIYNWIETHQPRFFREGSVGLAAQSPEANDSDRYYRDQNKVWTPKNTIQSTHIYEGKIEFNQSFTLTFNYELRSYDGINPKSAFLDLLGNILEVTHNRGKFWGGERRWLGAPRNKEGWKRANELFDKMSKGMDDSVSALFGCNSFDDLSSLCSGALKSIGNLVSGLVETAKDIVTDPSFKGKAEKTTKNVLHGLQGMLQNKLGRPAVYAMDSLLQGNDVGIWHVTIGNPRNPIMTIGNLILENSEITQYGPLGIDDFPTGLKVVITLKHARPRDITDISSMYTCGQGGLLLSLNNKNWRKYFNPSDAEDMQELGLGGRTEGMIIGEDPISFDPKANRNIEQTNSITGKKEKITKVSDESMIDTLWSNIS